MMAMILAAGLGTRLGALGKRKPKPMMEVEGKPLIEHNIIKLKEFGFCDIVINVSWLRHQIMDYLGDGRDWSVRIRYSVEENEPVGTGGGVKKALSLLGEDPFLLINSDVYSDIPFFNNTRFPSEKFGHLFLVDNPSHNPNGDFSLRGTDVICSPTKNPYTFSGVSFISPKIFENINETKFPLEPLLEKAAKNKLLEGSYFSGFWVDAGSPDRLTYLRSHLAKN